MPLCASCAFAAAHRRAWRYKGEHRSHIRRPDEWRATGVPEGAQPVDMRRDDVITAILAAAGGDPARPIALICARGVRSARLATTLHAAGFTHVIDVNEGMLGSAAGPGWIRAGLPVVTWTGT